jgi:hypothetical protein
MVKNEFIPSDDELDKLFGEDETEELSTEDDSSMKNQSTEQDSNNEEMDKLKDEIRELKDIALSYKDALEDRESEPSPEQVNQILSDVGEISEEDLEDLPQSVRDKIKKVDILEKKYAQMEERRRKDEVKSKADGFMRDLDSLSKKHPALKDKNVRYATLMYAANGLGDTSKEGFSRAFDTLSKSFSTDDIKADVTKQVKAAKQKRDTVPKVGKGGIPSLTTDNTPKSLDEATAMAQAYLKQL